MIFSIMYLRCGKLVWDTHWSLDIPPSCDFVRNGLAAHDADKAIVLDSEGSHLVVEERRRFDA